MNAPKQLPLGHTAHPISIIHGHVYVTPFSGHGQRYMHRQRYMHSMCIGGMTLYGFCDNYADMWTAFPVTRDRVAKWALFRSIPEHNALEGQKEALSLEERVIAIEQELERQSEISRMAAE